MRRRVIRASEIGEYIYCARAWRLRLDGIEAPNREALDSGERWHRKHGRGVRRMRQLRQVATISVLLALIVLTIICLQWWWR